MCGRVRSYTEEELMNLESALGLIVSALLLFYLFYALLRPEKF